MEQDKDVLIETIRLRSEREAAHLAGKFARAASEDREAILAAMQFEIWLAACCDDLAGLLPEAPEGPL